MSRRLLLPTHPCSPQLAPSCPHSPPTPLAFRPFYPLTQADVFETSAKAGQGVGDIFQCIVTHFQTRALAGDESRGRGLQTGGATQKQGGCC